MPANPAFRPLTFQMVVSLVSPYHKSSSTHQIVFMLCSIQVDWISESAVCCLSVIDGCHDSSWREWRWMNGFKRCACLASCTQRNAYRHRDRLISEETVGRATANWAAVQIHFHTVHSWKWNRIQTVLQKGLMQFQTFIPCKENMQKDLLNMKWWNQRKNYYISWKGNLGRTDLTKSRAWRLLHHTAALVTVTWKLVSEQLNIIASV